jgi:nucleotide-binding universal stress UspA family protein
MTLLNMITDLKHTAKNEMQKNDFGQFSNLIKSFFKINKFKKLHSIKKTIMTNTKKILIAVDFSSYSNEALELGLQIATQQKASIHLINAMPQINYYDWNMTGTVLPATTFEMGEIKIACEKKINDLIEKIKIEYPNVSISFEVTESISPADTIISRAEELKSELIILGSHGRKGMNRILMGSVAEYVMRHATCDVLVFKKALTAN